MKLTPLLLLMTLSIAGHAGQAYKSVDENGNITFSQFPPMDNQPAETIQLKTPKSSSSAKSKKALEDYRQKLLDGNNERNTETPEKKEDQEQAKIKAENCEKAKQKKLELVNSRLLYKTLANGERYWYSPKERKEQISEADEEVTQYCK